MANLLYTQVYILTDIQVNCTRFTYKVNTYRSTTQDNIQAGWYTQLNINSMHTNTGAYITPPSSTCDIKSSILIHTSIHTACSHREYIFLLIFK